MLIKYVAKRHIRPLITISRNYDNNTKKNESRISNSNISNRVKKHTNQFVMPNDDDNNNKK